MLIQIIVIFAKVGSVKNGIDSVAPIIPKVLRSTLTGPFALKIVFILNKVTNCGTATDKTNINRQNPLNFVPFLLIRSASIIPKIKHVNVAITAHINVQPKTGQNVDASLLPVESIATKLSSPTQSNNFPGG